MLDEKFRHAALRNIQCIGQHELPEKPGWLLANRTGLSKLDFLSFTKNNEFLYLKKQ